MADDIKIDSNKLDKLLSNLTNNLEKTSERIVDSLSDIALDEMKKKYAQSQNKPSEELDFYKEKSSDATEVVMSGTQAIYTEFGTGTQGGLHPHPIKGEFGLKPYNSGPKIRTAKSDIHIKDGGVIPAGTLYWTYKDESGQIHHTQGIPAQKIVFDAGQTVLKKMPSIIKNELGGMFK